MMEDNKVAKLVISTIIGEEVDELELGPQESTLHVETLTVCRLDFNAKILTPSGHKVVMIEMQKAQFPTDIVRFRRYLGVKYQKGNYFDEKNIETACQIYCIFFLGHGLECSKAPMLHVDYSVKESLSGKQLPNELVQGDEFIKGLHHKSWIIQIPYIQNPRRKNDLELLLQLFDQKSTGDDKKGLIIQNEENFPLPFQQILRRLQYAAGNATFRKYMDEEDDIIEGIKAQMRKNDYDAKKAVDAKLAEMRQQFELTLGESLKKLELALNENQKKHEEREKQFEEKERKLEQALHEKDKIIEELGRKVENLEKNK
jgi:hypothetical protein